MALTRRTFFGSVAATAIGPGMSVSGAKADAKLPRPPLFGREKAAKRFVVWGTYTCPFTGLLFQTLSGIVQDMPDAVNVEWRHFPIHPIDPALHVAALAFEGPHFWSFSFKMLTLVVKNGGNYDELTPAKLVEFAKEEGGSDEVLKQAYADKTKWEAVQQDMLAGRLMGVTATPGLFFNGYFLTPDGLPSDRAGFDKSLRAMLKAS